MKQATPPGPPTLSLNAGSVAEQEHVAASVLTVALFVAIVLPAVLTLTTVREELLRNDLLREDAVSRNLTPYGYTVSLLLYLVPVGTLLTWFYRNLERGSFRRRAFHLTLLFLVPIGFLLDFTLGNLFFAFPNQGAVLGIYMPGISFHNPWFERSLPIEEFVFYASGFLAMLLLYVWCNQVWVPAYGVADYSDTDRHPPYIVRIHWKSLGIGVAFFAFSLFYKKVLAPPDHQAGFPLYMTFLLMAAVIPGMLLHRCACPFINWRAFSVMLMWVLLTSLLWEGTLASPYGWWRYRPEWMMGLHIAAWSDLPVEAVVLWIAVSFTTISVYETIKVYLHMKTPSLKKALLGDTQFL